MAAASFSNALLAEYSIMPSKIYDLTEIKKDANNKIKENPISWIQTLFNSGRWLNTYELPFYKDTYLTANQYGKWATGRISTNDWSETKKRRMLQLYLLNLYNKMFLLIFQHHQHLLLVI